MKRSLQFGEEVTGNKALVFGQVGDCKRLSELSREGKRVCMMGTSKTENCREEIIHNTSHAISHVH